MNSKTYENENDTGPIIQLHLDGGDEPAVTTDVMFSGKDLENF